MRQATWYEVLCLANISLDAVCTLPNLQSRDKRLWQYVTSSEDPFFVQPQAVMQAG
jgi:hypothetical protein